MNHNPPLGGYWFLDVVPVWALFLLLNFLTVDILKLGRQVFENLAYNISFSSEYGDRMLVGCVAIVATIIQRGGLSPALNCWGFQIFGLVLAANLGIVWQYSVYKRDKKMGTIMDVYHNVLVAPVFLFFLSIGLPVVMASGTPLEQVFTGLFLLSWLALVGVDIRTGRSEQRKWLVRHGFGHLLR